ncbi:MAG: dihydrolipoyl dehydrogenase [Planctomycetes bacterium]|nr:dihydrolipoyl dehydrogenase [Planctomycetota bacterium]
MSQINTDVVVLGAGPAGYVAAIRLADLGKKVVCVEQNNLGGTCLNVGCIPSKALISAGHFMESTKHAADMGFSVETPKLDLSKLIAWKDGIVTRLTGGIGGLFKNRKIEWVKGKGTIASANKVTVETDAGKVEISCNDIIVASGSEPAPIPGFDFCDKVWSSTEGLAPTVLPKKLFVIGGGVIGMELGMFYAQVGTEVTVVEFMDQLLPGTDPELVKVVQRKAKKAGIKIHLKSAAKSWSKNGDGVQIVVDVNGKEQVFEADAILLTVGRRPVTDDIGLDKVGVKTDKRGFISVDAQCQTKTPHIYAVGDITTGPMLAHKGSAQGLVAAGAICRQPGIAYDYKVVPAVIFTDPEIAWTGLTEAQCKEQGLDYKVGRFNFAANGRAMSMHATDGLVKVITDAKDDTILGVHMVGPNVTDMITEGSLAIETGLTAEDITLTIHPHPTLSEVFMEACEDVHSMSPHAMAKKK